MRCPQCQTDNPEGAKFCLNCGQKLAPTCAQCGQELPAGSRFCFHCGAALAGPLAPAPPSPSRQVGDPLAAALRRLLPQAYVERLQATRGRMGSERRLVTILFSDVKGSTAMAETMDPEEWMEVMNGAFESLIPPVSKYEGTLARLMGDAILAFFGAPLAHEDDAERACRAALDIIAGAKEYAARLERERGLAGFNVRVGINTGLVVVGEVGTDMRVEYTAMGDAINLAARMEQAAPVGGILISHNTYQQVRGLFEVQTLEPLAVKGKAEPVQAYIVLKARPRAFRLGPRGVEGVATRTIGREAELKRLQDAFYTATEEGECQVVTVVGEAGAGKSRLLYEFMAWLELLPQPTRQFRGRARAETQNLPYALLRDLLAFRFEIQDSDPPPVVRKKLEDGLGEVLGNDPHGQMKAHLIGQLLGFDFGDSLYVREVLGDARQLRDRGLLYLVEYWQMGASITPTILLLEDIHWADDSSLDALSHLVTAIGAHGGAPLLLVANARPALLERRPHWGEGQTFHTRLLLPPLSKRDSRLLVEEILQKVEEVPPALRDLVVSVAEGNPLYIEEMIKMLIEEGVIVKGEECWRVDTTRLAEMRVPPTLTALIQARLDSLPLGERAVLQQSAVVGRIFWDGAVARLQQAAEEANEIDVPAALSALRSREMVYQRETSAFAGSQEYIFKHPALREVAYESILKKVRRGYHLLVAEWLIERSGERSAEYAGLIADHLEQAGERGRALAYLVQAGEQAAAHFANAEAVGYFTRALALTPETDVAGRYALLLSRERVYDLVGQRTAQAQDLEALEQLAEALDDDARRAEVALRRAAYNEATSNFPAGQSAAQEAVHRAIRAGAPPKEVEGLIAWARALWRQGHFAQAAEHLQKARQRAGESGYRVGEATSLHNLGTVQYFLGDYLAARSYLEQAREIRHEVGDRRGEGITLNNLAGVYHAMGDHARSQAVAEQSLAVYRAIGDRRNEAQTLSNLGSLYHTLGEPATARDHHLRALQIFVETGDRRGEASAARNVGLVLYDLGDLEAARRYCEQAVEITRVIGDRVGEGYALNHLAVVLERSAPQAAVSIYEQALTLRREIGQEACAIDDLAGLARLSLSQGQVEPALAYIEEAWAWIASHGVHGIEYPLRVYLSAADVWAAAGRPEQADQALSAAHTLLREQAARISAIPTRRAFLEQVPLHRQVQERTSWIDAQACR